LRQQSTQTSGNSFFAIEIHQNDRQIITKFSNHLQAGAARHCCILCGYSQQHERLVAFSDRPCYGDPFSAKGKTV